jgi:uncharacterized protein
MTNTLLIVMGILFFAALVRATLGFGDSLLAMPLLALAVGLRTATPLAAIMSSIIAASMLLQEWRTMDLRATWKLILSTLVGIPIGLLLLKNAPEAVVRVILGILLVLYGLYSLVRLPLPRLTHPLVVYLFGFVAGVLGGAYNTNGPPVILYGSMQGWPPERFRATLQGYFFPTGLIILAAHFASGLWTPDVLKMLLFSLPGIVLAILLGSLLARRIPSTRFSSLVYASLVLMGVLMFL